ncbi:hypothetical protein MMC32_001421 [Xylographa parallela]|nr:hypothetical protein [Xylographa parallela]
MPSVMKATAALLALPVALAAPTAAKHWHGWSGVSKFFPFGDSYTTTGFNVSGTQPNPGNPLGNPPYPGYTAVNGPGWIDDLTVKYNQSFIETYNLAYGGATVDASLVAQYLPTVLDFIHQVDSEFLPVYGTKANVAGWTADNSLFAAFFGINDVGNSYGAQNDALNGQIFDIYLKLVNQLYAAGARNFLFLNVPPVNLSPGTTEYGPGAIALEGLDIADFNDRLAAMAYGFAAANPDATVFQFDTNAIFSAVLTNPASFPATALYKNTTGYCPAYANGTPQPNTFYPNCTYPVNEYFWLNSLHPTYPMQDVMASQIVKELNGGDSDQPN